MSEPVHAQGWPEAPKTAKKASAPVKPAAKPEAKPATSTKPATKPPVKPEPKAEPKVAAKAEPKADVKPIDKVPAGSPLAEIVKLVQEQSTILTKVVVELDSQRKAIENQQHQIDSIRSAKVEAAPTATPVKTAAPAAIPTVAEVKATVPAPTVPKVDAPKAPEAPKAAAPKAATPAPAPVPVETGGAKLRLNGMFQGWFSAGTGVMDTFRLRRTEFKMTADINPQLKWTVMIDAAKALAVSNTFTTLNGTKVVTDSSVSQAGRMLQDAFVTLNYTKLFSIEVGQQKVPLGLEGVQSSGKLETVERALFMTDKARGGGFVDIRDLGVTVRGKMWANQVEYTAGVYNGFGESMNDVDKNNVKTYAARAIMKPAAVKGLQFGGSIGGGSVWGDDPTDRERAGVEAQFARGKYFFKAEYMTAQDGTTPRAGYYTHAAYRVAKSMDVLFRYDVYDPDTRDNSTAANVAERDYLGGVTYYLTGPGTMIQANYIYKTFGRIVTSRQLFLINVQTSW